uniref:AGC-kinase C-terminal domain-containing protein n=1 Tax=Euplotes harpa TaxID=151035 RepID=A0A7S3JA75_9SPIT|mmetsp:Transcript_23951/g.27584  ORF Transcript_23951/g.27584 Transcript_23951/m.27584 type:complete len:167 (+) Transcript_23951:574-1074(+)
MLSGKHPYKVKSNDKMAMFKRIIEKPVKMRPEFSDDARSLLNGLLALKIYNRLGCSDWGAEEIKSHDFFKSVSWSMLSRKEIEPPILPKINDEERIKNLKLDESSVEDLAAEMSNENNNEETKEDINFKRKKAKSKMIKTGEKEYRLFENFDYVREEKAIRKYSPV